MSRRAFLTERGFSLLEVAVATAVCSMGLGSLSLLMLVAVQGTVEARDRSLAAIHASELAEMILLHSDAVGHYLVDTPGEPSPCGFGSDCSDADLASYHLGSWRTALTRSLPGARGVVCRDRTPRDGTAIDPACDGAGGPVVKVLWRRPDNEGTDQDDRVTVAVPLP